MSQTGTEDAWSYPFEIPIPGTGRVGMHEHGYQRLPPRDGLFIVYPVGLRYVLGGTTWSGGNFSTRSKRAGFVLFIIISFEGRAALTVTSHGLTLQARYSFVCDPSAVPTRVSQTGTEDYCDPEPVQRSGTAGYGYTLLIS